MEILKQATNISFSRHGSMRLQQRGISRASVTSVLTYGKMIHKQHLKFFYLPKSIIRSAGLRDTDGLSNLIVITDLAQEEVITCYKSEKGVHSIKKKPKRLRKKKLESKRENRFPT
ncbi:DUF4258 domain-containing protein [Pleomorphovibrio marinus]|uniref:DUF4258 domain-containing protein n=1 Tax=Pleomorphovibrio marinus TaxID=2164132 RepID=UPI000E0A82AD|nr:DUF4258 domain-containing protein [Pleomorphovibrio marinus]